MQERSKGTMELPGELTTDILLRLPVKSLIRFRCVCKPWCSSFQTSDFISKYHQNNLKTNNLSLLLKRCCGSPDPRHIHYFSVLSTQNENGRNFFVKENFRLLFFDNGTGEPAIYGPCNGLLCLQQYDKVVLWNPSTRKFKILPQSSASRPSLPGFPIFGSLGFGYDSATDDYKVVRFFVNYYRGKHREMSRQAELYSLKSDSWKEIKLPVPEPNPSVSGIYRNGFYYWRSDDYTLSFDMANEKFSTLPLPFPKFDGPSEYYHWELLEFNGLLGAIAYPKKGRFLDLWVVNGSWTKEFRIESIPGMVRPLGFWKNGELFLESMNNELVLFDPATRELKKLGIESIDDHLGTMQVFAYAESLAPIYGASEHEEHIILQPPPENVSNRD